MLRLVFDRPADEPLQVLCLGAHSDDIEIGCGGTILRLIEEFPGIKVKWVVFSGLGQRGEEAAKSATEFLQGAGSTQILIREFRDGYFPSQTEAIKDAFEDLKADFSPDLIFTHYRHDLHQDHRKLNELALNTWRDHFMLEYEIPKYDGDLGSPNFFVTMNDGYRARKIELLMRFFQTQNNKHWFSPETFNAILRLRGMECHSESGYAEAFYSRKLSY